MKKVLAALLLITLAVAGCTPAQNATPTAAPTGADPSAGLVTVSLPVGYIPNVQFAPLYVAMDKGYFRQAGIDLKIDYSTEIDGVSLVGANKLQFSIASGEQVLLGREQGLPVTYVMSWYQQYPVGIASKKSANILKPQDLKGKKIGIPILSGASYIGLRALLQAGGLQEKDVTLDVVGFNQIEALTADREQAIVVYNANEPTQLAADGVEINLMRSSDYMQLVGNGLITNETTLQKNPALVRGMVKAILQGLSDSIADPDQAYEISKKYVENLGTADQKVQKQVLAVSIDEWKTDKMGASSQSAWDSMEKVMQDMGLLPQAVDTKQVFSNDFLPK
jgi:NitT/TauT family transport system substrate-binding protein